jgi:hypothetical protein
MSTIETAEERSEILSAEHLSRVDNLKAAFVDCSHLPAVRQGIENDAALTRRTAPKPPEKRSLAANDYDDKPPLGIAAFDAVEFFHFIFRPTLCLPTFDAFGEQPEVCSGRRLSSSQAILNGLDPRRILSA